jgi:small-conductance mechanosensitive channel
MRLRCRRSSALRWAREQRKEKDMNRIVYIVGLVVVVIAVLSFLGLR